ncbi:MAG: hypothetical protein V4475_00135 [Pseudomonadota bacterium]
MVDLFAAALLALAIPAPETAFNCRAGSKEITVTLAGDRLVYSYGVSGKPEIKLLGDPEGGVAYHRQLYARAEDQTLRFLNAGWSYVIFNRWQAPPPNQQGHRRMVPEYNGSGLLIMRGHVIIRRINCNKHSGDMHEWPIFGRLKQDDENLTPDDA